MSARRSRAMVLAALLLLVPLALRAHVHAAHPGPGCVVCAVSHHAPAVRTTVPALAAPDSVAALVDVSVVAPSAFGADPVHVGRGPPALLPRIVPA